LIGADLLVGVGRGETILIGADLLVGVGRGETILIGAESVKLICEPNSTTNPNPKSTNCETFFIITSFGVNIQDLNGNIKA
jgi:hypothetical protein